jgi:sugar fermentation stimulation protein A
MKYKEIQEAEFLSRPNRFIANVKVDGKVEAVHVKNTGRCKELLYKGVKVYLEDHTHSPNLRKTRYSLIAVEKRQAQEGEEEAVTRTVNIDSYAPNRVVGEALTEGLLELPGIGSQFSLVKAESSYGTSRLDFYVESEAGQKAFIEVKGATLEDGGIARFPDAPTERGIKHVKELCLAADKGFFAYIIFVIQMKGVSCFMPNDDTHPAFGAALREAAGRNVEVLAFDCCVTPESMSLNSRVTVIL